jgi:hypothetical protein
LGAGVSTLGENTIGIMVGTESAIGPVAGYLKSHQSSNVEKFNFTNEFVRLFNHCFVRKPLQHEESIKYIPTGSGGRSDSCCKRC